MTAVTVLAVNLASADARIGLWQRLDGSVLLRLAADPLSAGIAGSRYDANETVIRAWPMGRVTDRNDQNTDYHADQSHIALPQKGVGRQLSSA
jgi:hypothetical protein